jgi:hypothetical protein
MKNQKPNHAWVKPVLVLTIMLTTMLTTSALLMARGSASGKSPVTFNKDIAPIFFKSCAECHRPGETAPFSVLSYREVRPWAALACRPASWRMGQRPAFVPKGD